MDAPIARPRFGCAPEAEAPSTAAPFQVESVIRMMQAYLDQPLTLNDLADSAGWSPFHFHRLFRAATGIPPNAFLTTLRLQEAKRLLLTTSASVTDICYAVGYAGLGTFTARFTQLVGAPPGRLRQFANSTALPPLDRLGELRPMPSAPMRDGQIAGEIRAPAGGRGAVFIGLFPTAIPQARPVRGTVRSGPGRYRLAAPPDGRYHLLAAALPWAEDPRIPALAESGMLVATAAAPVVVRGGRTASAADLALRAPLPTDPPVLSCLPLLLSEQLAQTALSA